MLMVITSIKESPQCYLLFICIYLFLYLAVSGLHNYINCAWALVHVGSVLLVHGLSCPTAKGQLWNLSSLIRDGTLISCIGKQILNHWTTREVLK